MVNSNLMHVAVTTRTEATHGLSS